MERADVRTSTGGGSSSILGQSSFRTMRITDHLIWYPEIRIRSSRAVNLTGECPAKHYYSPQSLSIILDLGKHDIYDTFG